MNTNLEAKYRELVENANSIIMRMDMNGNVTFFNGFAQKFFGFLEKDILGKNVVGTIVPSKDFTGHDLIAMIKDILVNSQKYVNNENENITRDGRHVWISWTNKPVFDQNSNPLEILCIGNDITRLKEAEIELSKVKELTESASKIGIVACTPDFKIKAINTAAKRYFDLETVEAIGLDVIPLIFKHYQPTISEEEIKNLSAIHKTYDLIRPETDNNKTLYLQVNREVIKNPQQEVISIITSIQDVTEQRQEELLKQDFLGLISHKLRTPITVILQTAALLEQNKIETLGEKQKSFINNIVAESYKLNSLITNLLNFVLLNNQNMTNSKEPILLAEHISQIIDPLLKGEKKKPINFSLECADKSLALTMDRIYFDIMITNLVDNAIKFNDKKTVDIKVTVKKDAQAISISVADNGPGIPVEDQEKIFAGFYQIEKCFTGNVEGVGLGLPLVKKIIGAYGGTISVKSEIGHGTTFTLNFPVRQEHKLGT